MQPNNYPPRNNKSNNIHDFIRSHRTLSTIIAILGPILIIVVIVIIFINANRETELPPLVPEVAPIPSFQHRYLLNYTLGNTPATQAFADLGNTIVSAEELASAPSPSTDPHDNTYIIDLIEDTFTMLRDQPRTTYKVNIEVSDGRTYDLYLRIDPTYGSECFVVILDRTDLPSATDYAFIYTDPSVPNVSSITDQFTSWAKSFPLINLQITDKTSSADPADQ